MRYLCRRRSILTSLLRCIDVSSMNRGATFGEVRLRSTNQRVGFSKLTNQRVFDV